MVKAEPQHARNYHHQQPHQSIDHQRILQLAAYQLQSSFAQKGTHHRCQTVGESYRRDEYQCYDIIRERGRRQFLCAVVSYHQRVGQAHNDSTQLAYHDGKAQSEQSRVVSC